MWTNWLKTPQSSVLLCPKSRNIRFDIMDSEASASLSLRDPQHCWFELLSLLNELLCFTVAVTLCRFNFNYLCPSASVKDLASHLNLNSLVWALPSDWSFVLCVLCALCWFTVCFILLLGKMSSTKLFGSKSGGSKVTRNAPGNRTDVWRKKSCSWWEEKSSVSRRI
jgi:hypothetical protein